MGERRAISHVFILVEEPGDTASFGPDDQSAPPALGLVVENRVEHYGAAFAHDISQDAGIATVRSLDMRLVCIGRRITGASRLASLGA